MRRIISRLSLNPKILFLIDSSGAFITAFLLFAVLKSYSEFFGMPKATLNMLSVIAIAFCIYSFCCFLFVKKHWPSFLRVIIIGNILYCCITLAFAICNYAQLTISGRIYFLVEVVVICGLVYVEVKLLTSGNRR